MFAWIGRSDEPTACGVSTPLLDHLAGDFASELAALWPAPHRPFIEAPAERRHLACLAVARGGLAAESAHICLNAPFKRAVRALLPDAPAGLAGALARLGEVAWKAEDYLRLVRLLGEARTSQVLQHRRQIEPGFLAVLDRLSPALHAAGLARFDLDAEQAGILTDLHGALSRRDGDEASDAEVRRWAAAEGAKDLLTRAIASVRPALPAAPFEAQGLLKPIGALAELDEAGGRYKNCLASLRYAGHPDYAWFEWLGEPSAMIELHRDQLYGWTLSQARLARNEPVPGPQREAISDALRAAGVHVGFDAQDVRNVLAQARDGEKVTTEAETIGWCYGD